MVKKFACCLRGPYLGTQDEAVHAECTKLLARNEALHATLRTCKDLISQHHTSHVWDVAKRRTNEYELVSPGTSHMPGITMYNPISRSFFKLHEMLHDYWDVLGLGDHAPLRAMFLAEGPGGFMEAFVRFRALRRSSSSRMGAGGSHDELHGITLCPRGMRNVPHWKLQAIENALGAGGGCGRLRVHHGADGTGDLCAVHNVDHLCAELGEASCDLVTADGGFDFSGDFNSQEEHSMGLVVAEMYAALRLQKPGGALVLKVYDLHLASTMKLMYMLRCCYRTMRFVKPLSSRPANSEKYVLCGMFTEAPAHLLAALRAICTSLQKPPGASVPPKPPQGGRAPSCARSGPAAHRGSGHARAPQGGRGPPAAGGGAGAGAPHPVSKRSPGAPGASSTSSPSVGPTPAPGPAPAPAAALSAPAVVRMHLRRVLKMPASFVCDIVHYNTCYVAHQVCSIVQTLLEIEGVPLTPQGRAQRMHEQVRKALRWCHKYGIRASPRALQHYRVAMLALQMVVGPPASPSASPEEVRGGGQGAPEASGAPGASRAGGEGAAAIAGST